MTNRRLGALLGMFVILNLDVSMAAADVETVQAINQMRAEVDGRLDTLTNVTADVQASVGTDTLQRSVHQKLDLDRALQLERQLRAGDCTPALWLPVPAGGQLDLAVQHVGATIDLVAATGPANLADLNLIKARDEYGKATALIASGRFAAGCDKLGSALERISR